MSAQFLPPGVPRLKVLDLDLSTLVKTLYLPVPSKGGIELEWVEKSFKNDLVNGSERTRVLGYLPTLTLTWKVYDDRAGQGYTIGQADGNRPSAADLLQLLSLPTGRLKISPGPSPAGAITVDSTKVSGIGVIGLAGFAEGFSVTFRARTIRPDMTLETF